MLDLKETKHTQELHFHASSIKFSAFLKTFDFSVKHSLRRFCSLVRKKVVATRLCNKWLEHTFLTFEIE